MKKLRKMLGDINSKECIDLMQLIETQSQHTLSKWAIQYAKDNYLNIYDQYGLENKDFHCIIHQCEEYLNNQLPLKEVKSYLKEARLIAKDIKSPVAQAAARAIATACATITTPTNALGYLFYGAAAYAYHNAGIESSEIIYNELATKELQKAHQSLKEVAIENEEKPAKIKWNC